MEPIYTPLPVNRETVEPELQLVVFKLGTEEYGIRIENVKEVTIAKEISQIPRTPPHIIGVTSIRGEIIAVMDLELRFNLRTNSTISNAGNNYILVVEHDSQSIGIIVNEVPHSISIALSQIDRTPNVIQEADISEAFIEGIGKLDTGRLVIILDVLKILSATEGQFQQKQNKQASKK